MKEGGLRNDKEGDSLLLNGCNLNSLGYQPPAFSTQWNYEQSNSANSNGNGVSDTPQTGANASTVCGDCGAVIRNAANVAVHMRRHLGYKPYSCSCCLYTGYDEDDVRRHASRAHTTKNGSHVKFKPLGDMEKQVQEMLTASKTVASGAQKTNGQSNKRALDQSLSVLTNNSTPSEKLPMLVGPNTAMQSLLAVPSVSDNLTCDLCKGQAVLSHPSAVISHLKCHLNLTGYSCSLCDTVHVSWTALTQHMHQTHPHVPLHELADSLGQAMTALAEVAFGRRPARLECSLCGKHIVWSIAALKAHVSEHDGKYPFKCSQCGIASVDVTTAWDHWRKEHTDHFPVLNFSPLQTADHHNNNDQINPNNTLNLITAFPLLAPESIESLPADLNPLVELNVQESGGKTMVVEPSGPEDSKLGNVDNQKMSLICLLCGAHISRNMTCLIAHAKVHLAYKPLKCEYCPFRHFAMSKIRRHNTRVHRDLPVKVSYHPVGDIGSQIKSMKLKCFGNLASSAFWGMDKEAVSIEDAPEPEEMVSMDFVGPDHVSPPSQNGGLSPPGSDDESSINDSLQSSLTSPDPKSHPLNPLFPRGYAHMPQPNMSHVLEQLMRDGMGSAGSTSGGIFPSIMAPTNMLNGIRPMGMGEAHMKGEGKVIRTGPTATPPVGRSLNPSPMPPSHRHIETYDLNGMGKKVCLMCNTYIANNPSSFDNHACKHLDYKPYHCYYCQYQSYIRGKVTRHIQQVHNGLPVKIDHKPLPGIKEKIQQIKMKCFPFLMGDSTGGSMPSSKTPVPPTNVEETTCELCYMSVITLEGAMDEHLQAHIPVKYYHCPVCTYQTTYLIRAKQHVHSAHPTSQETRILCCPPEGIKGLQELRVRCFGTKFWNMEDREGYDMQFKNEPYEDVKDIKMEIGDNGIEDQFSLKLDSADNEDEEDMQQDTVNQSKDDKSQVGRLTCCLCKALVSNQPAMMASHIRNHMPDYKPYQCSYCPKKFTSEVEVKQHIMGMHRHVPLKVEYNPERAELEKVHLSCFPNTPPPALTDLPSSQVVARSRYEASQAGLAIHGPPWNANSNGTTLLKKLICQMCKNTIADNAKSVGIHVKNHLNYKPYRCPFCKYMSCEQSKARRHVEHVHSVSGDAVEIHAEPDIKERIKDMKSRCFPTLGNAGDDPGPDSPDDELNAEDSNDTLYRTAPTREQQCTMCKEMVSSVAFDDHCKSHLGKPFKCEYCTSRFLTEDKVLNHIVTVHPSIPPRFTNEGAIDNQLSIIKSKCFPERINEDQRSPEKMGYSLEERNSSSPKNAMVDGKLTCHVCDQLISVNPNSLEVHAKTHLNFKQHQCGYCNYKSCISGKVKRHLDNVHRGQEVSMLSFTSLSNGMKNIVAETRGVCFPQQEGPNYGRVGEVKDRMELAEFVESLRQKLLVEIENIDTESMDSLEVTAAHASVVSGDTETLPVNGSRPPSAMTPSDKLNDTEESIESQNIFVRPGSRADTPSDNGLYNNTGRVQIQCHLCDQQIADNPSSLGLHVRNHLDYKPFSCNLCEYKSPIQAKVKRHLRNVHKCPTNQMSYNPEPDIRHKVTEMKIRCFPRMADSGRGIGGNCGASPVSMVLEDSPTLVRNVPKPSGVLDILLSKKTTTVDVDEWGSSPTGLHTIKCRLCSAEIVDESLAKSQHINTHSNEGQWHCSDCGFSSFIQETVRAHAHSSHQSGAQPVKFDPDAQNDMIPEEFEKLTRECFPEANNDSGIESASLDGSLNEEDLEEVIDDDECSMDEDTDVTKMYLPRMTNNPDGTRHKCDKCDQYVPLSPSSMYIHLKTHMSYKPYSCVHCDYRSHVKSRVRRHICNKHKGQQMVINYQPILGIEKEVLRLKFECFPNSPSLSAVSQEKIGCLQCRTLVPDTPFSKSVHAKNHLDAKPYHCGYCAYKSCLKGETRLHLIEKHQSEDMAIVYVDEEVAKGDHLTNMISQCFNVPNVLSLVEPPNAVVALKTNLEGVEPKRIKLGPAYREWYCPYCPLSDTSKYRIKEHCITDHPGKPVDVNETNYSYPS